MYQINCFYLLFFVFQRYWFKSSNTKSKFGKLKQSLKANKIRHLYKCTLMLLLVIVTIYRFSLLYTVVGTKFFQKYKWLVLMRNTSNTYPQTQ